MVLTILRQMVKWRNGLISMRYIGEDMVLWVSSWIGIMVGGIKAYIWGLLSCQINRLSERCRRNAGFGLRGGGYSMV